MGYYMRYIVLEPLEKLQTHPLTLGEIEIALRQLDPEYSVELPQDVVYEMADLNYGGQVYVELEINRPGDDLFADEQAELIDELDSYTFDATEGQAAQAKLRHRLQQASLMVIARIIYGDNGLTDGVRLLEPLWDWLFRMYDGVLQVDYEGYYSAQNVLLELIDDEG